MGKRARGMETEGKPSVSELQKRVEGVEDAVVVIGMFFLFIFLLILFTIIFSIISSDSWNMPLDKILQTFGKSSFISQINQRIVILNKYLINPIN